MATKSPSTGSRSVIIGLCMGGDNFPVLSASQRTGCRRGRVGCRRSGFVSRRVRCCQISTALFRAKCFHPETFYPKHYIRDPRQQKLYICAGDGNFPRTSGLPTNWVPQGQVGCRRTGYVNYGICLRMATATVPDPFGLPTNWVPQGSGWLPQPALLVLRTL
jgi:hypothetical protein